MRILHIGTSGAIMDSFVEFVNLNFNSAAHSFMLTGPKDHAMPAGANVVDIRRIPRLLRYGPALWKPAHRAEMIFLHGLFDVVTLLMLLVQPWLLRKCYWVIWGGDLYAYRDRRNSVKNRLVNALRGRVIRRLGHVVTHIRGDYELARKWYGARGKWHDCFMYPSNLYRDHSALPEPHEGINFLLGNSASRTNCHADALEKLSTFASQDIRIYCPLSYGDVAYGDAVARLGAEMFGDKFIPLREFMPIDDYFLFLSRIDIAVFNHDRQQAMGNITSLLGLGVKVHMNESLTSFRTLTAYGLKVFDVRHITADKLSHVDAEINRSIVREVFSSGNLVDKLARMGFGGGDVLRN